MWHDVATKMMMLKCKLDLSVLQRSDIVSYREGSDNLIRWPQASTLKGRDSTILEELSVAREECFSLNHLHTLNYGFKHCIYNVNS